MQPETPQSPKPFSAMLRRIWNAMRRRPFTKLAALLIAFVFWAIVIASDQSLIREKTIANVPVTITGQETLRSRSLIVMDDLTSGTITVKLRAEVRQGDYDSTDASTFTPRLELASQISHAGPDQRVYFTAPESSAGTVIAFEPDSILVNVEEYTTRNRIPVIVEYEGELSTPLWFSTPMPDPWQVTVSGPKSYVDQVRRAVVKLPLGSLSATRTDDSVVGLIELQDDNQNAVTSPMLRITSDSVNIDSARIDLSVYPMRDIPVNVESLVSGIPAHGYEISDVRVTPAEIAVAAETEVLSEIEALFASSSVSVEDLSESLSAAVQLRSPSGIEHIASTEVTVEVDIVPADHVHVYNNLPVTVLGLDPGLTAKLSHSEMDAIIRGKYDQVQGLKASDVSLFVSAAGLEAGVHLLDVECIVNGTEQYEFEPELPQITVTLTESIAGS